MKNSTFLWLALVVSVSVVAARPHRLKEPGQESDDQVTEKKSQPIPTTTKDSCLSQASNIRVCNVNVTENVPINTTVAELPEENLHTNNTSFKIVGKLLVTAVNLDREQQESHRVSIFEDAQCTKLRLVLVVSVEDVNDNAPVVTESSIELYLPRTTSVGTALVQIEATDADAGVNGQLKYSLETAEEFFSIDPITGWIKLKKIPSETISYIVVEVADAGTPSLSTHPIVMMYLVD